MQCELDVIAPNFRRAADRWPQAPSLSAHYKLLVEMSVDGGYGLVDTVKSFVECTCRTVLNEYGRDSQQEDQSLTDIVRATLELLGFANARGADFFDRALSAYFRLSDDLNDVRNHCGPVVHGKDGFLDDIDGDLCTAFLVVGNSLLGIVLSALEGTKPDIIHTREPYERFGILNERIDKSVSVEAFVDVNDDDASATVVAMIRGPSAEEIRLELEPSRLLYETDRQAYLEVLASVGQGVPAISTGAITTRTEASTTLNSARKPKRRK
jgi:hypothetical protein